MPVALQVRTLQRNSLERCCRAVVQTCVLQHVIRLEMFRLPRTATAPFCPSEVRGSVLVSAATPLWQRMLRMAGPGLLVSVGYMDPGNWATDIEAGSKYGFALLWVVTASSIAAMLLQTLSLR